MVVPVLVEPVIGPVFLAHLPVEHLQSGLGFGLGTFEASERVTGVVVFGFPEDSHGGLFNHLSHVVFGESDNLFHVGLFYFFVHIMFSVFFYSEYSLEVLELVFRVCGLGVEREECHGVFGRVVVLVVEPVLVQPVPGPVFPAHFPVESHQSDFGPGLGLFEVIEQVPGVEESVFFVFGQSPSHSVFPGVSLRFDSLVEVAVDFIFQALWCRVVVMHGEEGVAVVVVEIDVGGSAHLSDDVLDGAVLLLGRFLAHVETVAFGYVPDGSPAYEIAHGVGSGPVVRELYAGVSEGAGNVPVVGASYSLSAGEVEHGAVRDDVSGLLRVFGGPVFVCRASEQGLRLLIFSGGLLSLPFFFLLIFTEGYSYEPAEFFLQCVAIGLEVEKAPYVLTVCLDASVVYPVAGPVLGCHLVVVVVLRLTQFLQPCVQRVYFVVYVIHLCPYCYIFHKYQAETEKPAR